MSAKQKRNLLRIIIAVALIVALHLIPTEGATRFLCYMLPYFVVGYDVLFKAARGLWKRQPLDENLLMTIATLGAIALAFTAGDGDYDEAVEVMLLYQIGEWFQSYAVGRSRRNISELMDVCPDYAEIESPSGELEKVDPDDVAIGTTIVVRPGERVPIDGVVTDGVSTLNLAALTGESRPKQVEPGDEIVSGSINLVGLLRVRTTKEFGESTATKILELIEDVGAKKSRSEDFITKFARVYTPIVVCAALAVAILPPIALSIFGNAPAWNVWTYRALTFLVISCPCALVISIPLSFFAGIGCASRRGILVKGSPYIESLAKIRTAVFDKTGTLTKGVFEVVAVHPEEFDETELLHLTAHVERYSTHPIAVALRAAYLKEKDGCSVEKVEELPGRGVKACVNGRTIYVGNGKLMDEIGVKWRDECHRKSGVVVHVAEQGRYLGHVVVSDVVKPNAEETIAALRRLGVKKTVIFTGDGRDAADRVAQELKIDAVYSELLPGDKVAKLEELLAQERPGKETLAFVGDGMNDAPVITRADVGVAMGAIGSAAAIEAADVVLMDDDPLKIATAIRIARRCIRIVKENIWFTIGVKVACLALGAAGIAGMGAAIFADVGVMILAVLNSIRALYPGRLS